MFNLDNLKELINNGRINEAIIKLEEIDKKEPGEAFPFLIDILRKTDNHALRNSIAITLMDMGKEEAVDYIIELLKYPKTQGNRGTLLYALKAFDYSAHIKLLVDFVINGNYEVRHESKELIEGLKSDITDDILLESIVKIKKEIDVLEDKHTVLSEAMDALCNLKKL